MINVLYFCAYCTSKTLYVIINPRHVHKGTETNKDATHHITVTSAPSMDVEALDREAMQQFLRETAVRDNDPLDIPQNGRADSLPQAEVVAFASGQTYDVYTGPGEHYVRAGNGDATVSTNDWIQVFGREGDYIMIQYHVTGHINRIGWITASALPDDVTVPELQFNAWVAVIDRKESATDDPLRQQSGEEVLRVEGGVLWLATLGSGWVYIEANDAGGRPARCFVPRDQITLYDDLQKSAEPAAVPATPVPYFQEATVNMPSVDETIAVYKERNTDSEVIGRFHNRVQCTAYADDGDWAYVLFPGSGYGYVNISAGWRGYVKTEHLVPTAFGPNSLYDLPAICDAVPNASIDTISFYRAASLFCSERAASHKS